MILSGVIEHIIYKNNENGYTVLELDTYDETIVCVGTLPLVAEGEELEAEGDYTDHRTYGRQFNVTNFTSRLPYSEDAILKYLASGIVRGIRAKTARTLIDNFGPETLNVIENEPDKIARLRGFSYERAEKMSQSMHEILGVKSILLYFQQFGITPTVAFKVYKFWGLKAYDILRLNPYRLCEIPGVGFELADAVAAKMNYDMSSKNRMQSAILYVLTYNLQNNGHTFLPKSKLSATAATLLETDADTAMENINEMIEDQVLVWCEKIGNTDGVYLRNIYDAEIYIKDRVIRAAELSQDYDGYFEEDIEQIQTSLNIKFEKKQQRAIREACRHQMMILTGGPGTGKTTTLNGIIKAFELRDISFAIAAPTGRAAKRVTELTGKEAKTIHRLLEYQPYEGEFVFMRNKDRPLEYDAVILDESSMIDMLLFLQLLEALPEASRLIMVGDINQLPPVGPGKIFRDIIESDIIPCIELTEIFRQAQTSLIVTNAHKINKGEMPELTDKTNDFFFLRSKSPDELLRLVSDLYSSRLPNAYGYDSLRDIQVLSPTRKGATGTAELNKTLRDRLNPPGPLKKELKFRGFTFREGDKVMQIRNNYDLTAEKDNGEVEFGVYNGDIGLIEEIYVREESIIVRYDDKKVSYPVEYIEDLELAYAVTVHKSQGSEFNCVILPLMDGADVLFTRNLLYTAVTRAKQTIILAGVPRRVEQMVNNVRSDKRYSGLKHRILEAEAQKTGCILN